MYKVNTRKVSFSHWFDVVKIVGYDYKMTGEDYHTLTTKKDLTLAEQQLLKMYGCKLKRVEA